MPVVGGLACFDVPVVGGLACFGVPVVGGLACFGVPVVGGLACFGVPVVCGLACFGVPVVGGLACFGACSLTAAAGRASSAASAVNKSCLPAPASGRREQHFREIKNELFFKNEDC